MLLTCDQLLLSHRGPVMMCKYKLLTGALKHPKPLLTTYYVINCKWVATTDYITRYQQSRILQRRTLAIAHNTPRFLILYLWGRCFPLRWVKTHPETANVITAPATITVAAMNSQSIRKASECNCAPRLLLLLRGARFVFICPFYTGLRVVTRCTAPFWHNFV